MSGKPSWFTFVRDAMIDGSPQVLIPRAGGVQLTYSAGVPQWAPLNGRDYASFDNTNIWRTALVPVGNVISMAGMFSPPSGQVEPFGMQFQNGDQFWVAPCHGASTGIRFSKGGTTHDFIVGQPASVPLNVISPAITSLNTVTGDIKYQAMSGVIYETNHPDLIGLGGGTGEAQFSGGMGTFGQRYTGILTDLGWGSSDWFADGGSDLIAEYSANIAGA